MSLFLITFLGNPGIQYEQTRHNAGRLLAGCACFADADWAQKFKGLHARITCSRVPVCLLKPETFMNASGESVQAAACYYRISPDRILVVHDELELPFGTTEIRLGGGTGGHNGIRSIGTALGTTSFWRFRIGIGRPAHGNVDSHVLSKFSGEEREWLPHLLSGSARDLELFLAYQAPKKTTHFT